MRIEFGKSWSRKLKGRVEQYEFEVGVLDDKPHRKPVEAGLFQTPPLGNYAGGSIRKATREPGELTIGQVLLENMKRLNINLLQRPFKEKNSDILRFTQAFLKYVTGKGELKRVENLLQAIVRNPMLKQEYGQNSSATADNKGFNRHLIDTAQMFKAIRARAKRVRG